MAVLGDANYLQVFYTIYLTDPGLVTSLNAQYWNGGYQHCPVTAAATFNAPLLFDVVVGGVIPPGVAYTDAVLNTNDFLRADVDSRDFPPLTTPYNGGQGLKVQTPGGIITPALFPGGTIAWRGSFLTIPAVSATPTGVLQTIWCMEGFETPINGSLRASVGGLGEIGMPTYSRVTGDQGVALYDSGASANYTFQVSDVLGATLPSSSWTQIYFRVKHIPTVPSYFLRIKDSAGGGTRLDIGINTSGQLYAVGESNGVTVTSSFIPTLNVWYRLDVISVFGAQASTSVSRHDLYINRSLITSATETSGTTGKLETVVLQKTNSSGAGLYIDLDDFTVRSAPSTLDGADWLNGTHIRRFSPTALSSDCSPNWVGGDATWLSGAFSESQANGYVNATASSRLSAVTNFTSTQLGAAAVQVSLNLKAVRTTTGASLGLRYTTQDAPTTPITALVAKELGSDSLKWTRTIPVNMAGSTTPIVLASAEVILDCGTLSASAEAIGFFASAAFLGAFGPEDDSTLIAPQPNPHQFAYPTSQWVSATSVPAAPVVIMSGTYVGNGTAQHIAMSAAPYWVTVRDVTQDKGKFWNSSLIDSLAFQVAGLFPDGFGPVTINTDGTASVLVEGGPGSQGNVSGRTYQWVAVSDPGMRFHINGNYAGDVNVAASQAFYLIDPQFTPTALFATPTFTGVGSATTTYYKGPGHATNAASLLDSAETATAMAISAGTLTAKTPLLTLNPDVNYSAWRPVDDRGYKGVVGITSYTGNATNPRAITVDLNGGSPLWCIVVPHNSAGIYRDPSHTGTNSSVVNAGNNASTGITGGDIDQITVNSALNANGIVYDVFCIAGTPNPGGWSGQVTNSIPVPTITPSSLGPYLPSDPNGWWFSDNGFTGGASIVTSTQRPYAPRDWTKLNPYDATGTGPSYLGGFPAASAVFNGHIIYPGNAYTVGTDQPPIRIFDGITDREIARIPPTASGVIPKAILSMMRQGDVIYLTTFDSGSSGIDYAGRVFSLDPLSNTLQVMGSFSSGEVPYALCWHMGRLWVGTNKGTGAGGKIYFIRPGLDTAFTTDYTLSTSTTGGCTSLCSFNGYLYVGTDNAAAAFAKVLQRDSLGVYTTSLTATGGTARVNNGFPHIIQFGTKIYATYWNPDTTNVAKIYAYDGTTWTAVFTGATTTLRPYILQFLALNNLYIAGGARDRSASLLYTSDGVTFTDLTQFLSGPLTETVIPTYGLV